MMRIMIEDITGIIEKNLDMEVNEFMKVNSTYFAQTVLER